MINDVLQLFVGSIAIVGLVLLFLGVNALMKSDYAP